MPLKMNPKSGSGAEMPAASFPDVGVPSTAETIVVGGGIIGSSIAYHLTKAGCEVLLLESRGIAAASSGANMGMINVSMKHPAFYTQLSFDSVCLYPELVEELGDNVIFTQEGTVYLIDVGQTSEDSGSRTHDQGQDGENLGDINKRFEGINHVKGLNVVPVLPEVVGKLLSFLPLRFSQAFFCATDCWVNPLQLNLALVGAAKRLGAEVVTNTRVLSVEVKKNQVDAVNTTRGRIRAKHVVLAAGTSLPALLKPLKINIPINSNRGHILVTEPVPFNLKPTVVYAGQSGDFVVLLQTDSKNLLIGATHEVGVNSTEVNLRVACDLARQAVSVYPILADYQLIRIWAGVRPWTRDVLPIIEKCDSPNGLYIICSHSGITLAPILGRIATDLISAGASSVFLDPYRLNRFQNKQIPRSLDNVTT
jgi:glycine/D-amino acid oxidase-like deaminating enzyme